jgi:LmbE family N-acetylglucosaminyl deacetylase
MRQTRPNVVITFGLDGISGHPDHIAVHHWTTAAFDLYQQETDYGQRLYFIAPSEATQQACGVPAAAGTLGGPVAFIDVEP